MLIYSKTYIRTLVRQHRARMCSGLKAAIETTAAELCISVEVVRAALKNEASES